MFTFEMKKLTAADVLAVNKAMQADDVDGIAVVIAKTCLSCPPEWGDPHVAETFASLDYVDFNDVLDAFHAAGEQATEDAPHTVDGAVFNFVGYKARAMGKFRRAMRASDITTLATIFTEIVKTTPSGWGKPTAAATYLKLPYHTAFLPLARMATADANDTEKNRSKRSLSG